jgi:hypothetical protein
VTRPDATLHLEVLDGFAAFFGHLTLSACPR